MKLSYPVASSDSNCSIMAWCHSYEDAFPFLKRAGYDAVELLVKNPDAVDREQLQRLLSENELVLSALGTTPMQKEESLFLMDPDPAVRKEAVRRLYGLIDLAAQFRTAVLIGKYRGMVRDEDGCRMEDLEKILAEADQKATEVGVELFLEPQNPTNINNLNTISESVEWIEKCGFRQVKLLMDTFHMNVTETSVAESMRKYPSYIGMIHMADSGRKVPGFGDIDVKAILSALEEAGFEGYLSMEIKQEPGTELTAALSAQSLKYMDYLKGV